MNSPLSEPAVRIGRKLIEQADVLRAFSDSTENYTRTYLTSAHRAASTQIQAWMREAGMSVREDAVGNVIGRYEGHTVDAPVVMTGSHFDTVRNGGRYDGILGVILPIACVAELHARGERLSCAIEIVGFADEEGVRFSTSFLGSSAIVGGFDAAVLDRQDGDGMSLREAIQACGLKPGDIAMAAYKPDSLAAFVEVHIEQGPVLLNENLALGVVTAIAGANRYRVSVRGEAGHAGTVPMGSRQDALAAAAEMVLAVETRAGRMEDQPAGLVGTVGKFIVPNGAANVIPAQVEFTIDVRAAVDASRDAAVTDCLAAFEAIAQRRGVTVTAERYSFAKATACHAALQAQFAAAIERAGLPVRALPSGAGHDAMTLARIAPVGMLFVRCGAGGVSHNPAEIIAADDAGLAATVFLDFLRHFQPVA
jgi:hydantoinase/carbamoylase family amidase